MKYFDDSDIIVQKVLSVKIVDTLRAILLKLLKVCEKTAVELNAIEKALEDAVDIEKVALYSKKQKEMQNKLILALALKNRVETISNRNSARVEYLSDRLEAVGIYNERFDKKVLANMEVCELSNLSENELNLNPAFSNNARMKFVHGETFVFVDGLLDFSVPYNKNVLRSLSQETLTKLIQMYPSSVATIPDDAIFDVHTKQTVLKSITSFVSDQVKSKSIKDINKELGNLLSFKTEITQTTTDYMAGVQNMFDVACKQQLLKKYPLRAKEFNEKFKCNEKSELLPASKKVPILAEGLAGEVEKTEEQESEEVRIEQEKEDLIQDLISMMYDNMIEEWQEEQDQNLQKETEEEQKKQEELLLKKQKEKEKKELEEAEKEEMAAELSRMLLKHDD